MNQKDQERDPASALGKGLFGKLIVDRGYISQLLFGQLLEAFGLQFTSNFRKNMKNSLKPLMDKAFRRKYAVIERVIGQFKNISQIQHSRHHSPINTFVNIIVGFIAYCHQPKKPPLNLLYSGWLRT